MVIVLNNPKYKLYLLNTYFDVIHTHNVINNTQDGLDEEVADIINKHPLTEFVVVSNGFCNQKIEYEANKLIKELKANDKRQIESRFDILDL